MITVLNIDIVTLFPEMVTAGFQTSIIGRAIDSGVVAIDTVNFRDFSTNKHHHVDDYPYGGGAGMLLKVEPLVAAITAAKEKQSGKRSRVILMDPSGKKFDQQTAVEFSQEEHLIFICGHYEGYDERIKDYTDDSYSIGDFVLTGGELPAMVMIDASVRLLPGVLGNEDSAIEESHSSGLLEYPQYTRPPEFDGKKVPEVLLSGHHGRIKEWRHYQALRKTYRERPDLLETYDMSPEETKWLVEIKNEQTKKVKKD